MKYSDLAVIRDVLFDVDHNIWLTEELGSQKNYQGLERTYNQATGYKCICEKQDKISRALSLMQQLLWEAPDAPATPF